MDTYLKVGPTTFMQSWQYDIESQLVI